MLEQVILGVLMQQPMSGYDIKKVMDHSVGLFYRASFGSLYPALGRLADKGRVTVTELEDSKNKKIYAIEEPGRADFLGWLKEPLDSNKNAHLIKIFFYDYLDEDTRQYRLAEYETGLRGKMGQIRAVQQIVAGELEQVDNPEDYYYRVSVLSYGLKHYEMEQQWIAQIKERMNLNEPR